MRFQILSGRFSKSSRTWQYSTQPSWPKHSGWKHVVKYLFSVLPGILLAACSLLPANSTDPTTALPTALILIETLPAMDETRQGITLEPAQMTTPSGPAAVTAVSIPTGPAPFHADVLVNANCRSGPGTVYQAVAGYFAGDQVDLVGISPDGKWLVVRMADNAGLCWIMGNLLDLETRARDLPVFPMPPTPVVPAAGPGDNTYELALLDLINQVRAEADVGLLTMEPRLVAAARSHSTDMAINAFFDHTGTGGTSFGQRIGSQGYLYSAAGETLFAGGDVNVCIQAWLDSPTHRETMLSPLFTQVGIGVFWYGASTYQVYVTADFASP